jgi:protein Tex
MTEEKFKELIASELNLNPVQVKNTISLLDEGGTIPFIARYRKEQTGSLDEEILRKIDDRIIYLRKLEERRQSILKTIEEQGKLTPELKSRIESTLKSQELEDLYLPYKPKRKTRASIAKEKGLEPLAELILEQEVENINIEEVVGPFLNEEKEVNKIEDAIDGACDIIAEQISEDIQIRNELRKIINKTGMLKSKSKSEEANQKYETYVEYQEKITNIPPHRILAMNRGEDEKMLKVSISIEQDFVLNKIEGYYLKNEKCIFTDHLKSAIKDSYARLLQPAIEREFRNMLTEKADDHAINVFALNLKNLLLQPPLAEKIIMGIDPGFRSGCKVAVIDYTGKYLKGITIYPHPPQKQFYESKSQLRELIEEYEVNIIAIGNGTASRETELLVSDLISEMENEDLQYIIVNEAGASVYSASPLAKEEFPELEASMRGNISIARRLQDPLAELVKIDPKSIGVGLYQHDVNQTQLSGSLNNVVESCVNSVGVDINTASVSLLKYVSGLNTNHAKSIVEYRNDNGRFNNRNELTKVRGVASKVFEQAAGFLKITKGDNPLDATSIHPESYDATEKLLKKFEIDDVNTGGKTLKQKISSEKLALTEIAGAINCGVPTLGDILLNLEKPGRDPRDNMTKPLFKKDILKIEDLRRDMIVEGTVRNVVDFGAFVDIGVKQDGLLHKSEMAAGFVKSPFEIVAVGDVIKMRIVSVDIERQRIAFSLKDLNSK